MPKDRKLVGAYVPIEHAVRFEAVARERGAGVSSLLRELIGGVAAGGPATEPRGVGRSEQVLVRLRGPEREALGQAARDRRTTPAAWVRALVLGTLASQPQWSREETEELRAIYGELRRIGNNVNQIARGVNAAVQAGDYPPEQGRAALEAVRLVMETMKPLGVVLERNGRYWRVEPDPDEAAAAAEARRRQGIARRTRPRRFQS